MAFKAALRFGGLCASVPNAALDKQPTRLWVVMPDATEPGKKSICKHFPGIFLGAIHLAGSDKALVASSGMSTGTFFWGIERKEITLVPIGAGGKAVTALTIPNDDDDTDFRHVPELGQILPSAAKINPDFKEDAASQGLVIARVIVEHGTLRTMPRSAHLPVYFPKGEKFATPDDADTFAHDFVVDLGELESLEIHVRSLDTGEVKTLVVAGSSDACEITFGNLCGDLWLKELGGIEPYLDEPHDDIIKDLDFEAFYYLSYPVPSTDPMGPVPTWSSGGGPGAKCHQAIFNPFIEDTE